MDNNQIVAAFNVKKQEHGITYNLKDEQVILTKAALNMRNSLGILPTGFGKTLCFTAPLVLWETGTVLVISPLIALMEDQIKSLREWKFKCARIESDMDNETEKGIKECTVNFVFASPESALSKIWTQEFTNKKWQKNIRLVVVDEAHCIVQWGTEFRPEYKELNRLRSLFPNTPIMALTATTTTAMKKQIMEELHIYEDETTVVTRVPDRSNIFIGRETREGNTEIEVTLKYVIDHLREKQRQSKKILIYCRRVETVAEVWMEIKHSLGENAFCDQVMDSDHLLVDMYHTSTGEESKKRIMENFTKPESSIRCLVATIAIGMGINIADVDMVIHYGCPADIINYWQEVGRAARDGRKGYAILIVDRYTLGAKNTTKEIKDICMTKENCIRQKILQNFAGSEKLTLTGNAEVCSGCDGGKCECIACKCCELCRDKCPCQSIGKQNAAKFLQD